jgi:hypothetical protein
VLVDHPGWSVGFRDPAHNAADPARERSATGQNACSPSSTACELTVSSRTIATALARAWRDAGTSVLFGVPGGGANLDVVGAAAGEGIRFVLTHDETAAGIMA